MSTETKTTTAMDLTGSVDPAKAEEYKAEGNKLFQDNKFAKAVDMYSAAILADGSKAVYFSNRAACHLKLESYGLALEDATKAIATDAKYSKSYYRRASAYMSLGKLKEAEKDFKTLTQLSPNDKDAATKLKECAKLLFEQRFKKAIESEQGKPASETVDEKSMVVEESYQGPHLTSPITLEFVQQLMEHFRQQKTLHRKYVYRILLDMIKLLQGLATLVDVEYGQGKHFTVCGDVHGQFFDVLNIFKLNGLPAPDNPYLFNGDFVDRGSWSLEVILTFFSFKLLYPQSFHMTRGNHESIQMNLTYGFKGEVVQKVDSGKAFDLFSEAFQWLPLGCVLNKKVLVVHGGLFSEDGVTLDDIRKIDRNQQPPEKGLMCELLWSDPQPQNGRAPSKRGVSLSFGPDVTAKFLQSNGLELLVRSHEVKEEGYQVEHNGRCITVFSAPNYCDSMGNKGAFIRFGSDMKPEFTKFTHVPHPTNVKPMQYAGPMWQMMGA